MKHVTFRIISGSSFFRGLSPEACLRLASLCGVKDLAKGETLFLEGKQGRSVYLLACGSVQLRKHNLEGNEIVIRTMKPGEVFAEVILLEEDRYPVTAVAVMPSRVLSLGKTDLLGLLDERPFRNEFIAMLMRKQRYLAERLRYITSYDVRDRLFLFLREQHGDKTAICPGTSKRNIASAIGATPETLSRLIQRLRREGVMEWKGGEIRLKPGFWEEFESPG